MKPSEDKSLLLKWLEGKLSKEDQKLIDDLPNMDAMSKAIDMIDTFEMPEPDLNKIEYGLDQKRQNTRPKPFVRRFLIPLSAVAAVLIGVVFWFVGTDTGNSTLLQTFAHQQEAFLLPDQSNIILNAASSVSYDEEKWPENRQLSLDGSAFFKVKSRKGTMAKGSTFTVHTSLGNVQVLGTQFEVLSRGDLFEVLCFEGKVRLRSPDFDVTIVGGQGFTNQSGKQKTFTIDDTSPSWLEGELIFREKKVDFVFEELERQYDVKIDFSVIRRTDRFTGTVPLNNLEVPLKIVCIAMGYEFSISSDEQEIIISK